MSEHKFPTEVIDLPSGGKVYPKDSPLAEGKIELKYMSEYFSFIFPFKTRLKLSSNGALFPLLLLIA